MANDLVGHTFGWLTVLQRGTPLLSLSGPRKGQIKAARWVCRCECGTVTEVITYNLTNHHTTSCGCRRAEQCGNNFRTHGESRSGNNTSEYQVWQDMKRRCYNPEWKQYADYGGRGITVCQRWLDSYKDFLTDMDRRPSSNHSIERRDNSLGYSPDNCYWATRQQQGRNKRNNRLLTYDGKTLTLVEWSMLTGLSSQTITKRIDNYGWPTIEALACAKISGRPKTSYQGVPHGLF